MAFQISATSFVVSSGSFHKSDHPIIFLKETMRLPGNARTLGRKGRNLKIEVSYSADDGDSYLGMWKKSVERERKGTEFQRIAEKSAGASEKADVEWVEENAEDIQKKNEEFKKILQVAKDERDRIQRIQVVDRASEVIAAAREVLVERNSSWGTDSGVSDSSAAEISRNDRKESGSLFGSYTGSSRKETPGPDFWLWTPPPDLDKNADDVNPKAKPISPYPIKRSSLMEKDRSMGFLPIPFESRHLEIPPLESVVDSEKKDAPISSQLKHSLEEEHELGVQFSEHAAEASHALNASNKSSSFGRMGDGSRWWREFGTEERSDGVLCKWTLIRGVSADNEMEWEEKFWEAADEFDYKELGSEKCGRDAEGNVWHEYWQESMMRENGLLHLEKSADKWGKNGKGGEWQEKWWEHYDSSEKAEKWADKWCSIDPNTYVEDGHAHVWHERWGEKYDGQGGSTKYTDKWAEKREGESEWTKWGDKWDENFDSNGHGMKQGESWWEGKYGERWNRTWGEAHNGSGWVHKYGKSSCGEHWDTHICQDTWYERFPHYGFWHCFRNSARLRMVTKPFSSS